MVEKLNEKQRAELLPALLQTGWALVDGRDAIRKTFKFKSFVRAFGWMSSVAIVSDKMNHHPEWSNVYATVDVVLTTHDADGLSELDITLARKMDMLA